MARILNNGNNAEIVSSACSKFKANYMADSQKNENESLQNISVSEDDELPSQKELFQVVTRNNLVSSPSEHDRKNAPRNEPYFKTSPDKEDLAQINCPICGVDLSFIQTSFSRESHVNRCLDAPSSYSAVLSSSTSVDANCSQFDLPSDPDPSNICLDPLIFCSLCGKDITKYKLNQQEQHLNQCLDEISEMPDASDTTLNTNDQKWTFSGANVGFLVYSTICFCCSKNWSARTKTLKAKIKHIRQCAKKNGVTVDKLLAQLSTMKEEFGRSVNENPSQPQASGKSKKLISFRSDHSKKKAKSTRTWDISVLDSDDDFESNVIIRPVDISATKRTKRASRKSDKGDEDLQLGLALSRSLKSHSQSEVMGGRTKRKTLEEMEIERNVSSIVPIDEFRRRMAEKAKFIIHSMETEREPSSYTPPFRSSLLVSETSSSSVPVADSPGIMIDRSYNKESSYKNSYVGKASLWRLAAADSDSGKDYVAEFMLNITEKYKSQHRSKKISSEQLTMTLNIIEDYSKSILQHVNSGDFGAGIYFVEALMKILDATVEQCQKDEICVQLPTSLDVSDDDFIPPLPPPLTFNENRATCDITRKFQHSFSPEVQKTNTSKHLVASFNSLSMSKPSDIWDQQDNKVTESGLQACEMPNYTQMDLSELKALVRKYGFRPTSRAIMVGQMKEVWRSLHIKEGTNLTESTLLVSHLYESIDGDSECDMSEENGQSNSYEDSCREVETEKELVDWEAIEAEERRKPIIYENFSHPEHHKLLFDYILGNKELYERILRYEPLEFEKFHRDLLGGLDIACTYWQLRQFLDNQGIIYVSKGANGWREPKAR